MTVTEQKQKQECYYNDRLPLAIYRELAAHLESINGLTTAIIQQDAVKFDYSYSQIKGIKITYPEDLSDKEQQQIQEILAHYQLTTNN